MNILLKSVTIIDSQSEYHGKTADIRIKDFTITEIGDLTPKDGEQLVERSNASVSTGWFDSSVSFGEPGYEERETIAHGLEVAARGGFTGIALNPNTNPVTDNSGGVLFVKNKAQGAATTLYPLGALTKNRESIDLAELYDMQQAGAVAFSDHRKAVENPNLLKIALQYTQGFDGLVCSFPNDHKIAGKGMVHEGEVSTSIGLKGIPVIAESLQVARDIHILEYTGGKLHIPTVSTAASVALIRAAKARNLNISCSVTIYNLVLTDEVLTDFNTNYKVLPPLRPEADRLALIEAVKDGTIDMVTTDHSPIDVEGKKVEFDNALYGTIGLETAFQSLLTVVSEKRAVQVLTAGRKRFTGESQTINIGEKANLTLFTSKGSTRFRKSDLISTSKNSAFINAQGKGKVYGIIANDKIVLND